MVGTIMLQIYLKRMPSLLVKLEQVRIDYPITTRVILVFANMTGAGITFALALLFSGQSASIVATIAGQVVSEGFLRWRVSVSIFLVSQFNDVFIQQ